MFINFIQNTALYKFILYFKYNIKIILFKQVFVNCDFLICKTQNYKHYVV